MRRFLFSAAVLAFLATSAYARADEPKGKAKTDVEAKKKTKAKPLNLYGLNLTLTLGSYNAITAAGEGNEWFLQYMFRLDWSLGKVLWKKNKVLKGLRAYLSFSVQNELVGTDPRFRSSSFSNPGFTAGNLENLAIQGQGGYLSESSSGSAETQVSGTDRRANYSDVSVGVLNSSWYEIPKVKINIDGGLKFVIPTSLQSRSKGLHTYSSIALGLTRTFSLPKKMSISIGYVFTWAHYFWKSDVPYVSDKYDEFTDPATGVSGTDFDHIPTSFNTHDAIVNGAWVSWSFLKYFTLFADYNHFWMAPYQPDKYCEVDLGGGLTTNACENTYDLRGYDRPLPWQTRNFQAVSFRLMYKPLPYLYINAGIMTEAPERKPNSSTYQQPFLVTNYNRYSMFFITMSINTEKLLNAIMKKGEKKTKTKSREDLMADVDENRSF